jgi:hypothetical protein
MFAAQHYDKESKTAPVTRLPFSLFIYGNEIMCKALLL